MAGFYAEFTMEVDFDGSRIGAGAQARLKVMSIARRRVEYGFVGSGWNIVGYLWTLAYRLASGAYDPVFELVYHERISKRTGST